MISKELLFARLRRKPRGPIRFPRPLPEGRLPRPLPWGRLRRIPKGFLRRMEGRLPRPLPEGFVSRPLPMQEGPVPRPRPLPERPLPVAAMKPAAPAVPVAYIVPSAPRAASGTVIEPEIVRARAGAAEETPAPLAEPAWWDREMVPGVRNLWLAAGAGALLLLLILKRRKTP